MNDRAFTILLVSSDRPLLARLSRFLEVFGYEVRQASGAEQAQAAAQSKAPDFLLVDGAAGQPAELSICRQIRKLSPQGYAFSLLITDVPEMANLTEALEAGFDDFLARPIVFGELLARLRAGTRVVEFERRLAGQTGLDPVTGLPDRTEILAKLRDRLTASAPGASWLAVLDLDYFTRIQRQAGQAVSQTILREAAQTLSGQPAVDPLVVALGDDRFAALGSSDESSGQAWAIAALQRLAGYEFQVESATFQISASCGLTALTGGDTTEAVFARAEQALALAKSSGRNCVRTAGEVEAEAAAWAALAEGGKLFATTLARDVMTSCPLLLSIDDTIEQAHALVELTRLAAIPVVDAEGRLAGIVTATQLDAVRSRSSRPRGGSSVRMLRHVMSADVKRFDELTPLAELMEFFTGDAAPLAVIVRDRRPKGIVSCQGLAALNEKLSAQHFSASAARTGASEDLLVPDLAMAE